MTRFPFLIIATMALAFAAQAQEAELPTSESVESLETDSAPAAIPATPEAAPPVEPQAEIPKTEPAKAKHYTGVKLRALNKLTAQQELLEMKLGAMSVFGDLEITPRQCWVAPSSMQPENAALVEVWQRQTDNSGPKRLFFGWLFALDKSISALESPVYDLSMVECTGDVKEVEMPEAAEGEAAADADDAAETDVPASEETAAPAEDSEAESSETIPAPPSVAETPAIRESTDVGQTPPDDIYAPPADAYLPSAPAQPASPDVTVTPPPQPGADEPFTVE